MIIDSHAHVFFSSFDEDRESVFERARDAGVVAIVSVATDLATSREVQSMQPNALRAFPTAGIHPHDSEAVGEVVWKALRDEAAKPGIVAVGETGLDFFKNYAPRETQIEAFLVQVQLARKLDLPLIIHCRDAFEEMAELLGSLAPLRGVMHCFTGDRETAARFLDLGLHVSFAAQITYPKKTEHIREAARFVPEDRLLVETDCPFLPPQPVRGQRNEPAFIVHTIDALAALRDATPDTIAEATARNAIALFGLEMD